MLTAFRQLILCQLVLFAITLNYQNPFCKKKNDSEGVVFVLISDKIKVTAEGYDVY